MTIIEDKGLKLHGNSEDDKRDFRIAWLNRRVENLEAIVFELLRDRVNYETVTGYLESLSNPGFTPSSVYIKDRGKNFADQVKRKYPPENLGWPPVTPSS